MFNMMMKHRPRRLLHAAVRHAGAAALGILAGACALAATAPDAAQIVARNAEARGGLDTWRTLKSLGEKGHLEHGQMKGPKTRHGGPSATHGALDQSLPFTLELKRPHKMRLEINLGDLTALQLFDGRQGWTVQPSPKGPMVRPFAPDEATAAAEQIDPEGPLLDAAAKGTAVSLEGQETIEGHRTYKLKLILKSGEERHVWVDADTYLDVKIDGNRIIEGRSWPSETYFYDWKKAGGIKLPYRVETSVDGVRTSNRILVERVLVNAPFADERFALPKDALAVPLAPPPAPVPGDVPATPNAAPGSVPAPAEKP
jgi:hypothetical protein